MHAQKPMRIPRGWGGGRALRRLVTTMGTGITAPRKLVIRNVKSICNGRNAEEGETQLRPGQATGKHGPDAAGRARGCARAVAGAGLPAVDDGFAGGGE